VSLSGQKITVAGTYKQNDGKMRVRGCATDNDKTFISFAPFSFAS